jgi:hypothetical protein
VIKARLDKKNGEGHVIFVGLTVEDVNKMLLLDQVVEIDPGELEVETAANIVIVCGQNEKVVRSRLHELVGE